MLISAINALTLSPALCGVLLRPHHGPRRGLIGLVMRSIDRVRDAYGAVVARMVRFSVIGLVMVAMAGAGIVGLSRITPTGFLPEDDQGMLFVVVQLPGGASVARTTNVIKQVEEIVKKEEAIADYLSVVGLNFIDNYSQSNAAFMVVTLKPFEERKGGRRACALLLPGLARNSGMSRVASSSQWRRRQSSDLERAADLPTCSKTCEAVTPKCLLRPCAG
jgi:multidrug efflux pump subunit AcrB